MNLGFTVIDSSVTSSCSSVVWRLHNFVMCMSYCYIYSGFEVMNRFSCSTEDVISTAHKN